MRKKGGEEFTTASKLIPQNILGNHEAQQHYGLQKKGVGFNLVNVLTVKTSHRS